MKQFYILVAAILFSGFGFGQDIIFSEAGGGAAPTGWTFENNVTSQPIDRGSYWLVEDGSTNDFIITTAYDLSSYASAEFTLDVATFGSGGANPAKIEISIDGGSNYTQTEVSNTPSGSSYIDGGTFSLNALSNQVVIRISTNGTSGRDVRLRNLELTATGGGTDPTITFDAATSTENETNATFNTSIPVTMTNYDSPVTISVAVNGSSTAEAGDYVLNTTSLTFNADETLNVSLDINDDADFDDETLLLDIAVTSGTADLGTSQHTVTILDDDAAPIPQVIITEVMQNPNFSPDNDGEYFEVYNPTDSDIDMNGWTIADNGADSHIISGSVVVPSLGFAVLGINSITEFNGGVTLDYEYSGITLANGDDEIILIDDNFNEIDRVEYDGGSVWPDPDGAAMIYIGTDAENNNDGTLWAEATESEGIFGDFGSPGTNGTGQVVSFLVYKNGAWSTEPSSSTGGRDAIIQDGVFTLSTDIAINDMIVNPGAALVVPSGTVLTSASVSLESTSSLYSSLIQDGTILGSISYSRHVNLVGSDTNGVGNDLISLPLMPTGGETFDQFLTRGTPTNETKLASVTTVATTYAFAPYDNTVGVLDFVNYTSNSTDALVVAKGYRAAMENPNTNLTFIGNALSSNQTIELVNFATGSQWNLIGNPFASYVDALAWITWNDAILDEDAMAIYAYNSNGEGENFTIINTVANTDINIAPGQAFFVAAGPGNLSGDAGDVIFAGNDGFPADMRTTTGTDDFIVGRSDTPNNQLHLTLTNSSASHKASFYFNEASTLGLDPGYDAATFGAFGDNAPLYSHLVEDNQGRAMAIQSLQNDALNEVSIPLGVNANQGEQIIFSIDFTNLPNTVNVYLEDNETNTTTLLNTSDYVLTPNNTINGTGRFFLRFSNTTLTNEDNALDTLNIYTNKFNKTVVIAGQLSEQTTANIYDLQGRLVNTSILDISKNNQSIQVGHLSTGVYVVQLETSKTSISQKVILH